MQHGPEILDWFVRYIHNYKYRKQMVLAHFEDLDSCVSESLSEVRWVKKFRQEQDRLYASKQEQPHRKPYMWVGFAGSKLS